mmetsp:Transcript_23267/g.65099  ORF Transcript_23267/g.65099 Transcript_23267/m.65099 type:complete len:486 (+) Transcript_23267:47-1504(+)
MGVGPTGLARGRKHSVDTTLPPASHYVARPARPVGTPPRLSSAELDAPPVPPHIPELSLPRRDAHGGAAGTGGSDTAESASSTRRAANSNEPTTVRSDAPTARSEATTVRCIDNGRASSKGSNSFMNASCVFDQTSDFSKTSMSMSFTCMRGPSRHVTALAMGSDNVLVQTLNLGRTLDTPGAVHGSCKSWTRGEVVGSGSLGTVVSALDHETGQIFAVKEVLISAPNAADVKFREDLEREVGIMQHLKHPHIVRYLGHDYIASHSSLYIYLEYMPGGSVASVLSQFGPLDESLMAVYARELLEGLEYLHTRHPPVVHRDIKGANVLVGIDCKVKLSDFGCSKRTMETMSVTMKGSVPWMAPEVISCTGYGRPADIWSFGCLMIEMGSGNRPWGDFDNMMAACVRIAMSEDTPPVPAGLSPTCHDFIDSCLRREPLIRPTATELLTHELVHELDEWGKERRDIDGYLDTVPDYGTMRELLPHYLD